MISFNMSCLEASNAGNEAPSVGCTCVATSTETQTGLTVLDTHNADWKHLIAARLLNGRPTCAPWRRAQIAVSPGSNRVSA